MKQKRYYRQMQQEMTNLINSKPKVEKHSFIPIKLGKAYAEYGNLKTYTNITQAEKKVTELKELGFNCFRRYQFPFLIMLSEYA